VTQRLLSIALIASAATFGISLAAEEDAEAGRHRARSAGRAHVRAGGHVHVRAGGHVRVRAPHVHWRVRRPAPPPVRVHVGGAIWIGGGWHGPRYAAPPPPIGCDCGPGYYHPVVPAQRTTAAVVVAPAPRPALPRWGIGVAAGGVDVQGEPDGDDLALLGRLRLTPGLLVEGEFGKSELAEGTRVDRRLGASLVYEIGAYNRWAPYLVGGLGVTQVNVGGGAYETTQEFGEVGIGLRVAATPRVHLAADIRAGSRSEADGGAVATQYRTVTPPQDESEEYTRARLSAILYF
jgi:hypothetical protein